MWFGNKPYILNRKYSTDGISFSTKIDRLLFGSFFFMSNDLIIHQKEVKNIYDVLSMHGGLTSSFFAVALVIGQYVNSRLFIGRIIKDSFTVKGRVGTKDKRMYNIKFSLCDKFTHLKAICKIIWCCKCGRPRSEYLS